jgi:hypothetical protein
MLLLLDVLSDAAGLRMMNMMLSLGSRLTVMASATGLEVPYRRRLPPLVRDLAPLVVLVFRAAILVLTNALPLASEVGVRGSRMMTCFHVAAVVAKNLELIS